MSDYFLYVVQLSDEVGPRLNPDKPSVYVGQSYREPEERFWQHRTGYKASRWVKKYGLRLLPRLYKDLNPIYSDERYEAEKELAEDLRSQGYTVYGGH